MAHRPEVKLEGVTAFADHLVRYERREGVRRIIVSPYAGGAEHELAMPEEVYDTGPATNAEFDTRTLRFSLHVVGHAQHRVRRRPRHR